MDTDTKNFLINIISGLFTAIVFLYLEKNGFTSLGYIVFGLYLLLVVLIAVNIFRAKKEIKTAPDKQPDDKIEINKKESLDDQLNRAILLHVLKLRGTNEIASAKIIADKMKQDSGVILAHLWKLHNDQFVTFLSTETGGKPPTPDTNFFLSPKAFEVINLSPLPPRPQKPPPRSRKSWVRDW